MNMGLLRNGLAVVIILLLAISSITPTVFGYNLRTINNEALVKTYNYDRYDLPEFYDCYNIDEIPGSVDHIGREYPDYDDIKSEKTTQSLYDLMDSAWPMYCHDTRHTGRSPYSTVDTCNETWKFETYGWAEGGPTINEEGGIYIGAYSLYAVYPNGTLKWEFNTIFSIVSAPAIDENGIIYFGIIYGEPNYLYAVYPNGTLKWKIPTGHIFSSPAIDDDGTIYIGTSDDVYPTKGSIWAINPDGTEKWRFQTNHIIYSSPAISIDGTIYCGCHDTYLYALYPNNGTLKWKYKTGDWIRTSPCIGDDGTIYVVSLDCYLHAVNPDGTLKWKTNVGAGTSPTIGWDGTIYCGYTKLHAVNPFNGSVKWTFDVGGTMRGGTPCNSIDGTIYVGTSDGGKIIAINSDGTLKWRKSVGTVESPPAIGEDGTVYIGTNHAPGEGSLHAFGIGDLQADANGPYYGLVDKPVQFTGHSKGGYSPHSYHWTFGDGESSDEQNPTHIYAAPGNYTVVLTVTDDTDNTSDDTTWAWVQNGNSPPDTPDIDGPNKGTAGKTYTFTFTSSDPEGLQVWYYIDWDDGTNTGWKGSYSSGLTKTFNHKWTNEGTYTIKCKAKDPYDDESPFGELIVKMPRDKAVSSSLFLRFLERYPLLNLFIQKLIL